MTPSRSFLHRLVGGLSPRLIKRISALQFHNPVFRAAIEAGSRFLRHRDLVIRHGVGAGLRFNTGEGNVGYVLGTTEQPMQQAIAEHLRPGGVFYDIGAHVGFFTVLGARLVGEQGRVYTFEPLPANVAALRHNLALNAFPHVELFDAAVSETAGESGLQLVGNSTGPKLLEAGVREDSRGTITVRTVALDALLAAGQIQPATVMKVDVEGAEIEVMRGARQLLTQHRPVVICEMHGRNAEYVALMAELGYQVRTLDGDPDVVNAYWNVHTLALPTEGR